MDSYDELRDGMVREWPYPVNYGKENLIETEVLVIGGGIAGCHAAINATKKGAKVAVVDKAPIIRSGSGGAGVDHWGGVLTHPSSKITPEQASERGGGGPFASGDYYMGHVQYICSKESYDALLDVEKMGIKIRDEDDEFKGAPFRDEKTKQLFAYDYKNPICLRVQGALIKPAMHKEMKRLEIDMHEHIMVTRLLNEGGKQGNRVVGAVGVHIRTGEFYIFKAKATILATAQPLRIWVFNTELVGSNVEHDDPNLAGDGDAMGWLAGAELTMMERSMDSSGPFRYPAYGTGNASNTWYPCSIVDANGKEIPWVDGEGNELKTVEERLRAGGGMGSKGAALIPDLSERIMKGEYAQPFFADLPGMPEHERRVIFGLMVAHEGKTRIPVYENYTRYGFDPDKDMLQANVLPPELAGKQIPPWDPKSKLHSAPQWRATAFIGGGGLSVDWRMKTSLDGLYAAGAQIAGGGGHAPAAATGRYAGRNAVAGLKEVDEPILDRGQIDTEKARIYAPVEQDGNVGWKELQAGICRIMQDYCGEFKSESVLKTGLWWLNNIRESEAENTYVRNPHELVRYHECMTRLTVSELIMQSSLLRKASSKYLDFKRLDYPEVDPPEWDKFVTIKLENDEVVAGEKPFKFWIQEPYSKDYLENYKKYSCL